MVSPESGKMLEDEVVKLFALIQKMREDLASVHAASGAPTLDTAADQLKAISEESTDATTKILAAIENISDVAATLSKEIKYQGARPHFATLTNESRHIIEACQAHDIIGQRISSVVRTINQVEGTLNSLVLTLGDHSIAGLASALKDIGEEDDGEPRITGPSLNGEGLAQDDIDDIFKSKAVNG